MPNKRNTQDKHLSNGSIIYWSHRQDPYVPVKCGQCGRERSVELNNTTRHDFTGVCKDCTTGAAIKDTTLINGSVVYWSRRKAQSVPVRCGQCGKEHTGHGANVRTESYTGLCRSCAHTGINSTTWKGGRVLKNGYFYVKVYPDHRFYESMANNMGYIAEHRLVMAQSLDRPLTPDEVVHHKNGEKHDNRLENLELYVSFKTHGEKLQERMPHPGFIPANKLKRLFEIAKGLLEKEEREGR